MRVLLTAAALALITSACSRSTAPSADSPTLTTLRSAPASAKVGEKTLVLSAYLWRDFMPPVPAGGPPTTLVVSIATSDSAVAPNVTLDAAWVVNGSDVWSPALEFDPLVDPYPNTILKFGRNGPKWEPGTTVDVVVRVRAPDGRSYLIRSAGEKVMAAY